MLRGRFGWLHSLQTRLILASVAILVLAILVTSGVFVYRERQEQRSEALQRVAYAANGFTISTFFGSSTSTQGLSESELGGEPIVQPDLPGSATAPDVTIGPVGQGVRATITQNQGAASPDIVNSGDYRILLVNAEGEVIKDPIGVLTGIKLDYPQTATADEKRGYVTWSGEPAMGTGGLTFVAPTTKAAELAASSGVKAVAAIDSRSLTADWLAAAPDFALAGLAALPLAVAAVVLVTRRITHPLRSLTHAVEAMSQGDFDQRVAVRGRDEVAILASSFTVMAGRVKERDSQLRNLIANVSHDMRTPLTSIQGYAEALADGVISPEEADRVGRIISEEARHASSLLANLLSLSEIDSGEVVVRRAPYDLGELVERCLRRLEPRARERGVEFHLQSAEMPALFGDAEKVERSICNLIENAVKFAHSRIDVIAAVDDGQVRLSVRNDGPPVPAEDAGRIFERFYRTNGPNVGTGLGLAIAREMIELNGGTVELVSAASPVEFRVSLPLP